jgi:hypothetical protein
MGKFINRSFHQERGDNKNPIVPSIPPYIFWFIRKIALRRLRHRAKGNISAS